MKANEAVKDIMKDQGVNQSTMANRIDVSLQTLHMRLKQENISIDKLQEMLRVLDYKIIIMPREVRTPTGGKEID